MINENYLIWKGQKYVIKSTELKYEEGVILNEIEAKHISMEFQNHYVPKDLDDESLNDEDETEAKISMKVKEYLDFAFKIINLISIISYMENLMRVNILNS